MIGATEYIYPDPVMEALLSKLSEVDCLLGTLFLGLRWSGVSLTQVHPPHPEAYVGPHSPPPQGLGRGAHCKPSDLTF